MEKNQHHHRQQVQLVHKVKLQEQKSKWLKEACKQSAIHGMPYVARNDLHWSERLFWFLTIIAATYSSINICLNQWERFRNNPIVYAMELTFDRKDFPYAGITICSDYQRDTDRNELIYNTWGIGSNETKAVYYQGFLNVLNTLRFDTMQALTPFENDTSLENLNFLEMLLALQSHIMPPPPNVKNEAASDKDKPTSEMLDYRRVIYAAAITEAGLCRTTSQLTRYTNPYGKIESLKVSNVHYCDFLSECVEKVLPMVNSTTKLTLYLHNVYDVVAPSDRSTITGIAGADTSLVMEILLHSTSAALEVRNLPIAYRKCRYPDENYLNYFKSYRPGLCRIECRIKAALSLCKCKPYFYAVGPKTPICGIKEMLCLARQNWSKTECPCVPLCEEISYVNMQGLSQSDTTSKFERTLVTKLSLPKMALRRRVVFSTDQLIMSFGGAIGLFLGASFMTFYGLIYVFLDYVTSKCQNIYRKLKLRR